MASVTLLLPARSRLPATPLPAAVSRALDRALPAHGEAGEQAQLARHFDVQGEGWPVAALTRQRDAGDASGALWLRADPCHVAPDMHGARMLSHGETLGLTEADAQAFAPMLQALFAEAGFVFDAPSPSRWYVRLPAGTALPAFVAPEHVLGDDLFAHLPPGAEGRRWRALLSEAQVLLHGHPRNDQRRAEGRQAVNSVWFWGEGVLPAQVSGRHRQVRSNDALLQSLAQAAGIPIGDDSGNGSSDVLVDLRQLRSLQQFAEGAVAPLLAALRRRELKQVRLDFEDGLQLLLTRAQRWRFWAPPRVLHET